MALNRGGQAVADQVHRELQRPLAGADGLNETIVIGLAQAWSVHAA